MGKREILMNKKELKYAFIYTLIMAWGMFVSYHIFGYNYDSNKIDTVLIYFELAMTIFAVWIYCKHYANTAFTRLKITGAFLIYSIFMIFAFVLYLLQGADKANTEYFIYIVITTALVATSEEIMYRGIVVTGLLKHNSKVKAIIYSAILFSLLHTVNILGGVSISSMLIQLVNTFVLGIVLACFRVENKNIAPLIVYHFIWDMVLISPIFVKKYIGIIAAIVGLSIVLSIMLPIKIYKQNTK